MQQTLVCMFFFTFLEEIRHKCCLCKVNLVFCIQIFSLMSKGYSCLDKQQFKMLVTFSRIFVGDTKITFGYNVAAPLTNLRYFNHFILEKCIGITRLKAVNYFHKSTPPQVFDWTLNSSLFSINGTKYSRMDQVISFHKVYLVYS